MSTTIGIIGGSGLYALEGLEAVESQEVSTPYGAPSGPITQGLLGNSKVLFLPRHGPGHRLLPSEVPYRANIFALKSLGARWVLSVSAVGSLQEHLQPGHFVLPDQFVDRTQGRPATFFGDGMVAHVSLANPTCPALRNALVEPIENAHITCHGQATYVCIDGPAFSTRAESNLYRQWSMDIIGMTAFPEVRLAREAQLHYATIGLVTDYDCWRNATDEVDVESVLAILHQNSANIRRALQDVVPRIAALTGSGCSCATSLQYSVVTAEAQVPSETRKKLQPLFA